MFRPLAEHRLFLFSLFPCFRQARPAVDPVAQMNGQMAIRVTAAGGAAAQIDDISSDGGLSIIGSVGRSDRSMEDY